VLFWAVTVIMSLGGAAKALFKLANAMAIAIERMAPPVRMRSVLSEGIIFMCWLSASFYFVWFKYLGGEDCGDPGALL
jgi:hypothetical protein